MRNVVHKLLSALPTFALAVLALVASADPPAAKQTLDNLTALLLFPLAFWGIFVIILLYVALWWFTGVEKPTHRAKIKPELLKFYTSFIVGQNEMITATTDEKFDLAREKLKASLDLAAPWIFNNLGPAAHARLKSPTSQSLDYVWEGEHLSEIRQIRNNCLSLNAARIKILDEMVQSNAWDQVGT